MTHEYSIEELAASVQVWCEKHRILPANGQAAEEISERTIRYYRTIGLVDKPAGRYIKTFSEKHRLQLIAIRTYQSQGIPLRRIREHLYGKSLEDLQKFEKLAAKIDAKERARDFAGPFSPPDATESWAVAPLAEGFMLLSRDNRRLPLQAVEQINRIIRGIYADADNNQE